MKRCGSALLLALLLAACAEEAKRPEPPPPAPPVAEAPPVAPMPPKLESQPLRHLLGRNLAPQPTRPLNIRSRCTHRDAIGTRTRLDLLVKEGVLKKFSAEIAIAKHGVCRFDGKTFAQKETLPQVLLAAKDGSECTVRLWEQGKRTTIAFNQCPGACAGDAFSYLWPIMVDTKSGRCF